jgi:hypothetical protein
MSIDDLPIDLAELVVFLEQTWLEPLIQQSPVNFFAADSTGRLVICPEDGAPWCTIPPEWREWFEAEAAKGSETRDSLLQALAKGFHRVKNETCSPHALRCSFYCIIKGRLSCKPWSFYSILPQAERGPDML